MESVIIDVVPATCASQWFILPFYHSTNVLNYDNVNAALDNWKDTFNNVCDTHAPVKEKLVRGTQLPQWINRDFIQLTKDRDYYYKRAHKTNDPDDWKTAIKK